MNQENEQRKTQKIQNSDLGTQIFATNEILPPKNTALMQRFTFHPMERATRQYNTETREIRLLEKVKMLLLDNNIDLPYSSVIEQAKALGYTELADLLTQDE